MINIGGNPLMIILAIVAALGGVGLYFVRNFRPELARDHDIFFSAIALVYGIILLAFNFRMEITTQLAQVLVVGFAGWFAVESLVLRQALASQARRSSTPNPVMDMDDDPIGSDYRVEIDPSREISARRDRNTRRMRGSAPSDSTSELRGDVEQERRTKRSRRGNEPVIDIDEDDIRPVNPKRRPRPSSDAKNGRENRDRDMGSESDDEIRGASSSRRRRSTSKPTSSEPDAEVNDFDDF
ncbi:Ycf66 family protein [Tumidithrix helvetica PCC 7403]